MNGVLGHSIAHSYQNVDPLKHLEKIEVIQMILSYKLPTIGVDGAETKFIFEPEF